MTEAQIRRYRAGKESWDLRNPDATPQEREAAYTSIYRQVLGLDVTEDRIARVRAATERWAANTLP
jgi:hypothetical protein